MNNELVYKDSLLEISSDKIVFKNYYFPSLKPKEVSIESIDKVEVKEPSMRTGKYRFHGTGDLRTWFPLDNARNTRDIIFFITLKHRWSRIGFTVEDSHTVQRIFRGKGLLR
jgi:hypothetical protein